MPFHTRRRVTRGTLVAGALAVLAIPAYGQPALEEIIVVSQKREQSLQDVPMAVSALSGSVMGKVGVTDLRDVVALSPSVYFGTAQAVSNATFLRVRGLGTTGNNAGFESSVGVFIDDVYQPRPGLAISEFVDIDRVEVLRGPQGTLFGRNTSAGALNIKSAAPVLGESAGFAELTIGDPGLFAVQGAYNVDAGENLALRFAGALRQRDGTIEALTAGTEDSDDRDRMLLRAQGLYAFSEDASLRVILNYSDSSEICCLPVQATQGIATGLHPQDGETVSPPGVSVFGRDIRQTDSMNRFEDATQLGVSTHFNWQINDRAELTWVTGFSDAEATLWGDTDFSAASFLIFPEDNPNESTLESLSSELRLQGLAFNDRFDWMVGLFFADESNTATNSGMAGSNLSIAPVLNTPITGQSVKNLFEQDTSVFALFTHNIIDLSERFQLTVGLRYSDESKEGGFVSSVGDDVGCLAASTSATYIGTLTSAAGAVAAVAADPTSATLVATRNALFTAVGGLGFLRSLACLPVYTSVAASEAARMAGNEAVSSINDDLAESLGGRRQQTYGLYNDKFEDDAVTMYVNLKYDFSDDLAGYVGFSQGFKSGGINLDVTGTGFDFPIFESEQIDSLEFGLKSTLLDGRMTLNVAAYIMDIENLQILELDGLSFRVFAVPEATATGLEIDLAARLSEGFTLRAGLTLSDTDADRQNSGSNPLANDFKGPCNKFHYTASATVCGSGSLPNAPETVVTLGFDWALPLGGYQLTVVPNVRYESDAITSTDNLLFENDAFTVVDLRVSFAGADERWAVDLWSRNLTDEVAFTRTVGALAGTFGRVSGSTIGFLNTGRTIGLSGRYNF